MSTPSALSTVSPTSALPPSATAATVPRLFDHTRQSSLGRIEHTQLEESALLPGRNVVPLHDDLNVTSSCDPTDVLLEEVDVPAVRCIA